MTRTVADIAVEFGAKRFVLVSTDKAVNAKGVMGSTKAMCEWIIEAWGQRDDTGLVSAQSASETSSGRPGA